MMSDRAEALAIYGGARAVRMSYRERWRKVALRDLLRIVRRGLGDVNTETRGGMVSTLERAFARLTQTSYGLLMNSGTAALHSAYFAVGVKPGDEVIVPAYTFFATGAPVLQLGGIPVFCDVDPATLTADPDDIERRITPRTRAVCVVHIWGNPARMDRIAEIARKHQVALIEDCSHAHGASFGGKPVGSIGDIGCFSMQGTKPVSGGELGIAVTSDPELYDRMLLLGHYGRVAPDGKTDRYSAVDNLSLGVKYRPHLFGTLLAWGALQRLPELNRLRRRNYAILTEELRDCRAVEPIAMYEGAERGGMLEFPFRLRSEHAGDWSVGGFAQAAAAEGVPITVDRYGKFGARASILPETPIFSDFDFSVLGGALGTLPPASEWATDLATLPQARRLADELMTMRPLTKVSERFVRDCATGLKKVARIAASGADLRGGMAAAGAGAVLATSG